MFSAPHRPSKTKPATPLALGGRPNSLILACAIFPDSCPAAAVFEAIAFIHTFNKILSIVVSNVDLEHVFEVHCFKMTIDCQGNLGPIGSVLSVASMAKTQPGLNKIM